MSDKIIVIAGAGIAGLTSALALAKYGIKSIILEKNEQIQEFGAGLQLGPNAHRALNLIGLKDDLAKVSFEPEGIDIYSFAGKKPISTLRLGQSARERFGVPYSVIHRADLVQLLYEKTLQTNLIDIKFNITEFFINEINNNKLENLSVSFTDENGVENKINCFAFLGADGVGSTTRTKYLGGTQAKYSGFVAWRALIEMERLENVLNLNNTSLIWGRGFHTVAYPLKSRPVVNIAFFTRETMSVGFGIRQTPNLPPTIKKDERLAKICDCANSWTHWPLAGVSTKIWHKGAIGLIGDAAHAMLPFQAQGAAMGIEDAIILAPLLANEKNAATAFEIYQNKRQKRVAKLSRISKNNALIFHMPPPLSLARNMVVKMQGPLNHFSRLSWIYDFDPTI